MILLIENFEGDAMRTVSGVTGAAPAWLEIIEGIEGQEAQKVPLPPQGVVASTVRFEPPLEPERQEWFIGSSAQPMVRLSDPNRQPPHIQSPANGMVLALDPDIPARHQAVVFEAESGPMSLAGYWTASSWVRVAPCSGRRCLGTTCCSSLGRMARSMTG